VGAGGRVLRVVVEEVENPASSLRDAVAETGFRKGKVEESVGGLEVRRGQLCVVKAFVDGGQEFVGETEPGLAGKNGVGGVEGGGESLTDASETVEGNAGRVGVGDVVVIEGVGDDEGSRTFIAGEDEAEVVEWEEVGRETRVRESEKVVERVGVAHGREVERRQCEKRGKYRRV